MATIRNLLVRLGVDVDPMERGFNKAAKLADQFDKVFSKVAKTGAATAGIASLAGAGTALTAAIAPAAGALVAMPAAMAATKAATATLKVGLIGVADAMGAMAEGDAKKLKKALAELSPSARSFVTATGEMLQEFESLKKSVQERLFEDLGKQIAPVSNNLMPALKTGMEGVAGSFNLSAKEALKFAATPVAKGTLNAVFATTKTVMDKASTAVQPLLGGVASLVKLGLPLAQRLAEWAINGIKVAGAFLSSEAGAAKLSGWATRAGDTLAQLGRIAANLGRFLGGVFESAKFSGDGVLSTIEQVTAKMAKFSQSAGGQERLTEGFTLLLEILRAVVDVLPLFMGPLAAVSRLLTSMSPEVRGVVTQFLAFAVVGTLLAGKLAGTVGILKNVTMAAVGAGGAAIKFGQGMVQGSAGLAAGSGAAAKAGAAVRSFGATMVAGIATSGRMVVSLSATAGAYLLTGVQAAGAAIKTGLFTAASLASTAASKVMAAGIWLVNTAMRANPIGLVITALVALGAGLVLAYNKSATFRAIVQGAWKGIQTAVSFAWNSVIKPAFAAITSFIVNTLGPKVLWFHNSVVKPVFGFIGKVIAFTWGSVIKPAFNALVSFFTGTLGPKFLWFHNSIVKPIMTQVGSVIKGAWTNVIKPIFDFLAKTITQTIPNAFKTGVAAIKTIWDKVASIAKTPVNFVIGLYNDGVVNLVNRLASFVGITTRLGTISKFADGGVMPGYAPGKDKLLAAVSPGESIFRPEFTRAVGSGFVKDANSIARSRGPKGVRSWLTGPGALGGEGLAFARGGVVPGFAGHYAFGGIIGDFIQGVKDFTIGNVAKGARGLLDRVFGAAVPGGGILKQIISAVPKWITDKVVGWISSKVESGVGGPKIAAASRFAKAQSGKPYVWGGVGPGGYDCSGFMSAIQNFIRGRNPYSRLYSTHSFGASGPDGMVKNLRSGFMVGVTDAGVGHMAGTLGNMNVESRGSAGVVIGPNARGFNNGLFTRRYGLKYDDGGILEPGYTPVYNGTRKPEYVFTRDQMETMGGGNTYHITAQVPIGASKGEVGREIVEYIKEHERRSGSRWRGTK